MNVLDALEKLREKFNLVLNDNVPSPGRFDKFGTNILNPTGRQGAEMRLAQLLFANNKTKERTSINLYYDLFSNNFFIRAATGRIFTANDGEESIIMDSDFFAKNSKNKNKDGVYMFRRTEEEITIEQYRKLPPKPADIIETYARGYVCEIFRDYLSRCQYRITKDMIKDPRPSTDRDGKNLEVKKFSKSELEDVVEQINSFITGQRDINGRSSGSNTSEEKTPEQATGTEAL